MRVRGLLDSIIDQPDVEIYASSHGITRVLLGDRVAAIPDAATAIFDVPGTPGTPDASDAPDASGAPGVASWIPSATHLTTAGEHVEGTGKDERGWGSGGSAETSDSCVRAWQHARHAAQEIADYLRGAREEFSVPLAPASTSPFTMSVHEAIATIPYGQRWTYAELAAAVGKPGAMRAVGTACGKNPLPILVPCHRVVRADGTLGHYTGGDAIKVDLLALESGTGG